MLTLACGPGVMKGPHDEACQAATSDAVIVEHLLGAAFAGKMHRHREAVDAATPLLFA